MGTRGMQVAMGRVRQGRLMVVLALHVAVGACAATSAASGWRGNVRLPAGGATYVVRKGDTAYGIARRHGLTVAELAAQNHLRSPEQLTVGTRLRIRQPTASLGRAPAPRVHTLAPIPPLPGVALGWPVRGTITSRFGRRGQRPHDGIDIGAPRGTPVAAAADGEVVFASRHGGYGNLVILQHANGLMTIYAHHDCNLVHAGQRVHRGEIIAKVGATGRATGPHLHFEVRRGARPDDPMRYLGR